MNAVMGYEPAEGEIRYKGTDIYQEYERMKYEIGYVPQEDLLRKNDSVYDTLLNAARMRLPVMEKEEYDRHVEETLHMLGLERLRDALVVKLSGGQRKRLSIAVEYVGNPSLFFLDEPDSGLDGTMARQLWENLRSIADQGKIVMVISHSPDRAFKLFDKIIVLAKNSEEEGRLVYYGSPKDACAFFEVDDLEGIMRRINYTEEGGEGLADLAERRISGQGQIAVYLGKCFRLFRNEKQWKNFLSSFIIIVIISMVTGPDMFNTYDATNKGAFAVISACIWSGLFNSIQSICRERAIIKREYRTGLRISSYILAHVIYEMFLCAGESMIVLIVVLVRNHSHLPPSGLVLPMFIELYLTIFLTTFCADMIAMLVSCIVRNEMSAMMIMPFILVVQLVMAGVVFDLTGITELISYLTASRWGVQAIISIARTNSSVDLQAEWLANAGTGGAGVLMKDWLLLLVFCLIYIVLAIIMLGFVDKDER